MKSTEGSSHGPGPRLKWGRARILLRVRRQIRNLSALGLQVALHRGRKQGYDVRLGYEHPRNVHCSDLNELRLLVSSVYSNMELLPESEASENVERLLHLSRTIQQRLRSRFTAEEILRSSPGGWPGTKEVVLHSLIRRYRPQEVIETGVAQGVSSTFILDALSQNGSGHLTSIDWPNFSMEGYHYEDGHTIDPVYVKEELGVGWLVPEALRARWTLIIGSSQSVLPALLTRPDLFFHDSKHTYEHMMFEFEWAWSHMSEGGFLASDDISWNTAFSDFITAHEPHVDAMSTRIVGVIRKVSKT
jgi:hypothetical protein